METIATSNSRPRSSITPADLSRVLRRAYPHARGVFAFLLNYRPYICPFHELLKRVPAEERTFIDIGSGVGMMCALLAYITGATRLIGVDTCQRDIDIARTTVLPATASATFHCVVPDDEWPQTRVDSVFCVDVLHHVPAAQQHDFVQRLSRLNFSGRIYLKDMSPRPWWQAIFSHLHDFVLRHERISLRDEHEVKRWLEAEGLAVSEPERLRGWWYSHYLLTAERPARSHAGTA
jgi:2-polyprenyl-3-methyl-5-hydroxy-6-metoxy-1,4-benzoquinol methylase